MTTAARRRAAAVLAVAAALPLACSSLYYKTQETLFGNEKRDILADRVEDGRDDQQAAKEQFQSALEAFKAVTGFTGGELEDTYDRLQDELDDCESRAADVTGRIRQIEDVAADFFAEWEEELETFTNAEYKRQSRDLLHASRGRYDELISKMRRAEAKMEPVLLVFREQVLFLKHNLNAQAIASLQDNVVAIEGDVESLVADMEASIAEADAFIESLG